MKRNAKILAVIPARAGSKGVPNKNIRLIGGKPLVAYTIDATLCSRYVTDIIVTTDSPMVKIIANQKGVKVHDRPPELCGDEVTLDGVVYDAVKDIDCDVVVTLQPTSPTLQTETLDGAIEKLFECELDTVISASNRPHLAWTVDAEGHTVPAYSKRLNRQYLPPYYVETGAFLISRREVVTPKSRIGVKVDVFEISDDEAMDIDDFFANLHNGVHIVGIDDGGDIILHSNIVDKVIDDDRGLRIEAGVWLVTEEVLRVEYYGSRNGCTLNHTSREFGGIEVSCVG